jgi:hypothetical protein
MKTAEEIMTRKVLTVNKILSITVSISLMMITTSLE